jgi:hypothetical protein
MTQQVFEIDIPEQGILKRLSLQEAQEFFDDEIAFYQRISGAINQNLQFGQWGIGSQAAILNSARSLCQATRSSISSEQTPNQLNDFIQKARSFELVIGQGKIGEHIETLIANGQNIQAQWLFTLFNTAGDKNNSWISPFRAIALGNPALLAFSDITSAQAARQSFLLRFVRYLGHCLICHQTKARKITMPYYFLSRLPPYRHKPAPPCR